MDFNSNSFLGTQFQAPVEKRSTPEGENFYTCTLKAGPYISVTGTGNSPEEASANLLLRMIEFDMIVDIKGKA